MISLQATFYIMNIDEVKISRIINKITSGGEDKDCYAVCWIQHGIEHIEINGTRYNSVSNSIFFLTPGFDWKIYKNGSAGASGYVLYLPRKILNYPTFKNLHITQVRLFQSDEIPKVNLSPGIEKRIQSILEMLDELIGTSLNHREEAILSLLNTFFVYCDGQCNIKSVISDNNAKSVLVYKFKKSIDRGISEYHEVSSYARLLNISDRYLNECVKEVLGVNAKSLIDEQLVIRARHKLKFTDSTIKEVAYDLGFSSPDYFSYFLKKHTGVTPSQLRKG